MSSENQPTLKRYAQAAEIIHDFLTGKNSLRNLCYAPKVEDKKPTFALTVQTLKYRNVLLYLLSLAQVPGFRYYELVQYDQLLKQLSTQLLSINTNPTTANLEARVPTTRDDEDTVRYEGELYKVKRARLIWSQQQENKAAGKRDPNELVTLPDTPLDTTTSNNDSNSANTTTTAPAATGKKRKKLEALKLKEEAAVATQEPTPPPASERQQTTGGGNGADDENDDVTGISNTWYSAYITYHHNNNTNSNTNTAANNKKKIVTPPPAATTPTPPADGTQQQKTQEEKDQQFVRQKYDYNNNTYRFPIECMLVVAYDLLFGTKEIHKLSTMGQPSLKSVYEKGVVDAIRLFNIPNPNKLLTISQLQIRADLLTKAKSGAVSLDEIAQNVDELNAMAKAKYDDDKKKSKKLLNKSLSIIKQSCADDIKCPIVPTTYLSAPPIMAPDYAEKFKILPGQTYKQRLIVVVNYLYQFLLDNNPRVNQQYQQQQERAKKQQELLEAQPKKEQDAAEGEKKEKDKEKDPRANINYDVFIPMELRGKYKRQIPRYIRVNTNKTTHYEVINTLIQNYGYTQLDQIPRAFRFPDPTPLRDGTAGDVDVEMKDGTEEGNKDEDEEKEEDNKKKNADQFDTRAPSNLDVDHIISLYYTPNLRTNTKLWVELEEVLASPILSKSTEKKRTKEEQKALEQQHQRYLEDMEDFNTQPLSYRQSTPQEREANVEKIENKNKGKNFWVDQVLPDLLCFSPNDDFIIRSNLVNDGKLVIQDRSSCLPPIILHPPQGSVVLDACSAPGNKTSYLSACMKNTGKVYAIELNKTRAELMRQRMETTNSTNVEVVNTSFFDITPTDPKYCDVEYILLDPSCSGSGNIHTPQYLDILLSTSTMISPFNNTGQSEMDETNGTQTSFDTNIYTPPSTEQLQHVKSLSELQLRLLRHALSFPKIKAIIYSTCSIYTYENEYVVNNIMPDMQQHGFDLVPALPLFPGRGVNQLIKDGNYDGKTGGDVAQNEKVDKKDKKNKKKDTTTTTTSTQNTLHADMNLTVRVDHKLYHAGGFYVALFAKEGVYNNGMLGELLTQTQQRYPQNFQ